MKVIVRRSPRPRPVRSEVALALACAIVGLCSGQARAQSGATMRYPPTPRGAVTDDLSGIRVADPYRWLENVGSAEVRDWVAAENSVTESWLAQVPQRAEIVNRLRRASDFVESTAPRIGGDRLYYFERKPDQNVAAVLVQEHRDAPPRVLIDPNTFSREGMLALVDALPAPDGRYLAYTVAVQGSSWRTARVRDTRTGQDLDETIQGLNRTPLAWTGDARGFFYVRSDAGRSTASAADPLAPAGRDQLFYHRIGRAQSADQLVFDASDHPEWRLDAAVSEDGHYLVISAQPGTEERNRLYLIDLDNPRRPNLGAPLVTLFGTADARYEFAGNAGQLLFIRTNKSSPRSRLVAVDINSPDESHWTTIVRETYDPLVAALRVDDRIVAHRLHDAHSVLELYALDGGARGTIQLPGIGTVTQLSAHSDDRSLYFTYTSFLQPPTVYRYDLDTRTVTPFRDAPHDSLLTTYETTQLFYTSTDGTRIPMFITARRGITLTGRHPTLLTSIGAFGESATPAYSPLFAAWLDLGGIIAVPNVRGGGEYGRAWHAAGAGPAKQTSFDDFVAAAQFLIRERYTQPASLGVLGHGVGGLLAGVAITRHPELFAGAAIDAGLFDMARYSRFAAGARWTSEFGSPADAAALRVLLAYSPLQNVRPGVRYPATLLSVGDRDDVMTPAHSYKFAAMLQANQAGAGPVLLRVARDVGYGPAMPSAARIALAADRLSFLFSSIVQP
jgi:prolyl oligopeptidase